MMMKRKFEFKFHCSNLLAEGARLGGGGAAGRKARFGILSFETKMRKKK
jgi:hypothetical protein